MEFVSDGCLHLTGYHPADLVANRTVAYEDIIDPADREAVRRPRRGGHRRQAFLRADLPHPDRERRSASGFGSGAAGCSPPRASCWRSRASSSDISERTKAEEALRQSEERYRLALQATQEIMYDWDIAQRRGVLEPQPHQRARVRPRRRWAARSRAGSARVHPDDAARVRRELAAAVAHGEVFSSEYRDPQEDRRVRHAPGPWADPPRPRRKGRPHGGGDHRPHHQQAAPGPAPPGPEDRGGRPARRRDRARLQQPPDGAAGLHRAAAAAPGRRPPGAAGAGNDPAHGKACRGLHPGPAGVSPAGRCWSPSTSTSTASSPRPCPCCAG